LPPGLYGVAKPRISIRTDQLRLALGLDFGTESVAHLGVAYEGLGEYGKAIESYERAAALSESTDMRILVSMLLLAPPAFGMGMMFPLGLNIWRRHSELLPFFWSAIAQEGQLYGNTNKGSFAVLTNGKKFTYPGFNEILTGHRSLSTHVLNLGVDRFD
jgi:tetratricopeptide (TPR) repeat protein